jgi:hypothetical protein
MLTFLSTVKSRLLLTDTTDDAFLTGLITAVGERFDQETNRDLQYGDNYTYEFDADYQEIVPTSYPIRYITGFALKTTERQGFRPLNPPPDYIIRKRTTITLTTGPLGSREQLGQMTYSAGYVTPDMGTPADDQVALPADISQAAAEQVIYWYQNRNRLGLSQANTTGASVTQYADLDLIPLVIGILRPYKRWNL